MEKLAKFRRWINRDDGGYYQVGNRSIGVLESVGYLTTTSSVFLWILHSQTGLSSIWAFGTGFGGLLLAVAGIRLRAEKQEPEQAVLVHFLYGSNDLSSIDSLEEKLEEAIVRDGVGEFDGNEVAADGSEGTLYMYGPDADALFSSVRPILESTHFMQGARAQLRYGPPGDAGVYEVEVVLGRNQSEEPRHS